MKIGLHLNPPTPFLQNPSEPSMPFIAWTRVFENYLLAIQENALADAQKCVLLIHCLGTECQRLFYPRTGADNFYETALMALSNRSLGLPGKKRKYAPLSLLD